MSLFLTHAYTLRISKKHLFFPFHFPLSYAQHDAMLQQCFFLLVFITTAITMTISDVSLFPDGITFRFGSRSVRLSNVKPSTVQLGMSSFNSTSTGLTIIFADPVKASLVADAVVDGALSFSDVSINAQVSGYVHVTKEVFDTCRMDTFAVSTCTMRLSAVATLPLIGSLTVNDEDVCDYAAEAVQQLLTPKPYVLYPPALPDTTSLAKSTYLMRLKLVNLFADSTGLPVESEFVASNVIRMAIGMPLRSSLAFDSAHESDVEVFDAIAVLTKLAKKMLNVSTQSLQSGEVVIPLNGAGELRVPTLRNIVHKAIGESAVVSLQTYLPRTSGIVYDIVVQDFRCRMLNTLCSLPAEGGVQVVNARLGGLGDLGVMFDNAVGARVDSLLTNVTLAAFKIAGSTFGDRIYLPVM